MEKEMWYDDLLTQRIAANGGIHPILVLNHSDTVSGTTFFDDGSIIYWGEKSMVGESPTFVINGRPEGGERVGMDLQDLGEYGYDFAKDFFENGPSPETEIRVMTPDEEAKWEEAFHGPTDR